MTPVGDVVVVGAGHNALVAACYLAAAGCDVEVIESAPVLGGAVSTVERFPGVRMDRGSSAHIMIRQTGIIEELDLAAHGLVYQDLDPWGFAPYEVDGEQRAITFWVDLDRTCASIEQAVGAADADGYRRFVTDWLPINEAVFDFFGTEPTPLAMARGMARIGWLRRGRLAGTIRSLIGSADALLDDYFTSAPLKTALAWMAAQSGPPTHEPGTAELLGWLSMLHRQAPGHPVGGSGMLSEALVRRLRSDGGTLRLGDRVTEVARDGGRMRVTTAAGRQLAARAVLSGTHVWTTADLIAASNPVAAGRLRGAARPGNGIGMVVRALTSAPPRYPADHAGLAHRSMALLADSRLALRECYGDFLAGRCPTNPAALVMTPSVDDPTLAPEGRHTVTIWGQWHPFELSTERWSEVREREGDKLIEVVDRWAPGFAGSVLDAHVQSPQDLADEIGLRRGNVMHLDMTLDQMFSLRPTAQDSRYRVTGAPGLYLTGASTHPGGGVFGASGRSAARAILRDGSR